MQAIVNARILKGDAFTEGLTVFIEGGSIAAVSEEKPAPGTEIIDAAHHMLVPGFIDLQIYGSGGNLFSAYPTQDTLQAMDAHLQSIGTTSFLACVATNTKETVDACIKAAKAYRPQAKGFAGLHLEGPYLNPKKRGAHIENLIRKAELDEVKQLLELGDGIIKMMTIAPELQEDKVMDYLLDNGVILSLGHSDATFEQATAAYNRGIASTTHLFNAMSPLHHRQPGIPTAVFNHGTAMSSIIADGYHVDFEVIKAACKLMDDRLFLITDAVTACSIGPYQHVLQGEKFVTQDGTLSGANISLLRAVQNCVQHCQVPLEKALKMATSYPARLMGPAFKKGSIEKGFDADLLLLDADLQLKRVFTRADFS